ncbi:hypothetical protein M569_07170 [Genlisea aurea]|uniref:Protein DETOXIFICATION n=1 Tax=Genlisea aurea TaxID=192259 RepID=S8CRW4_9LAMI|nr:hypothetical protein M569_07170 [Genlisea aurea]
MAALSILSWFVVLAEFIYIFGGWCPDSWKGFSKAALKDIVPAVKLSMSSGVMVCLEIWYTAILVLTAGYMKNAEVEIAAFSACLNITTWELMNSVRVANELGRGDAKAVVFSIRVLVSTSIAVGVAFWILCLVFGKKLGYLFSEDEAVVETISDLSLLLAFSLLFNFFYPLFSAGLQTTVAVINIVCFYLIGIPVGIVFGYVAHLQVKVWYMDGNAVWHGIIAECVALAVMTWRINWDEEVLKTSNRRRIDYTRVSYVPGRLCILHVTSYQNQDCSVPDFQAHPKTTHL